jgi:ADP-ribose pyrophosphatase YjhB (NUDIX family)
VNRCEAERVNSVTDRLSGPVRFAEAVVRRLLHFYWRFGRGVTLGVRALVRDGEGRIFLVKHSYVSGWHLPGGGVEIGETMLSALTRELREEGNIEIEGSPRLFAVYFNAKISRRDHVALFVIENFSQSSPPRRNAEIIDHGFFPLTALPDGITSSTRARLAEALEGKAPTEYW